jgi:hypothetical protein
MVLFPLDNQAGNDKIVVWSFAGRVLRKSPGHRGGRDRGGRDVAISIDDAATEAEGGARDEACVQAEFHYGSGFHGMIYLELSG